MRAGQLRKGSHTLCGGSMSAGLRADVVRNPSNASLKSGPRKLQAVAKSLFSMAVATA
jgi:hypothetical protein